MLCTTSMATTNGHVCPPKRKAVPRSVLRVEESTERGTGCLSAPREVTSTASEHPARATTPWTVLSTVRRSRADHPASGSRDARHASDKKKRRHRLGGTGAA